MNWTFFISFYVTRWYINSIVSPSLTEFIQNSWPFHNTLQMNFVLFICIWLIYTMSATMRSRCRCDELLNDWIKSVGQLFLPIYLSDRSCGLHFERWMMPSSNHFTSISVNGHSHKYNYNIRNLSKVLGHRLLHNDGSQCDKKRYMSIPLDNWKVYA